MKTRELLMLVMTTFITAVSLQAQTINSRDGFKLLASSSNLEISPEKDATTDITIFRSKKYKSVKINLETPNLPDGILAKVQQDTNDPSLYHLSFSSGELTKKGSYTIVVYGMHDTMKKGIMLKLNVSEMVERENSTTSLRNEG